MKNKINQLRAEHKWSQAVLADMVGVSRQAINAVETGKHDPSLLLAFKIAHAFNLAIEEVFDPEDQLTS
ncbi:MAG: helix-turn-helix transcriptional regulator [Pseudomonadota bacterium]